MTDDRLQQRADRLAARVEALAAALQASGAPEDASAQLLSRASTAALQALSLELLLDQHAATRRSASARRHTEPRRRENVVSGSLHTESPTGSSQGSERSPVAA